MSENKEKKRRPTVSVVCATYNRAEMVRDTVLAAWNQTLKPDEIIVSDDCSPDDTVKVLRELQKLIPILKVIESKKNSGGVPNWNQVINASNGDIIAWCSDDDRFLPEHLERAVSYLVTHDDVGLVHAGFINVEQLENGSETRAESVLKSNAEIVIDMEGLITYMTQYYNWPFHPSTWVFRRKLWKAVGTFNQRFALADTDWFIRAALKGRLAYLPTIDVLNRRHAGNWSNRVGAVEMQREFYVTMHAFLVESEGCRQTDFRAIKQFNKWLYVYRKYLIRIYISRSRAGQFSIAEDCLRALVESTPSLKFVPFIILAAIMKSSSYFLYGLQAALPGGRNKYKNLGITVP